MSNLRTRPSLVTAVVLSILAYGALQSLILHQLGSVANDLFQLQLTHDYDAFVAIMTRWNPAEAELFLSHFWLDFIHPFIYGTALCFGLALAFNVAQVDAQWDWLLGVPFIATACDLAENVGYLIFFETWQQSPMSDVLPGLFVVANACAWLKWAVAALCLLAIIALSSRRLIAALGRRP